MASEAMPSSSQPKTILLLTHARTASHVLQKMLSEQPNIMYGYQHFLPTRTQLRAVVKAGPLDCQTDKSLQVALARSQSECYQQMEGFLFDAHSQGKNALEYQQPHSMASPAAISAFLYGSGQHETQSEIDFWTACQQGKDQTTKQPEKRTNITVLPDSVLLRPGTIPIFNFRHPALIIDGIYRGYTTLTAFRDGTEMHQNITWGGTLHWIRKLYDWYLTHGGAFGIQPIILDADDYLGPNKEMLMRKLCDAVNNQADCPVFDIDSVIYTWPKATNSDIAAMPEISRQSQKTLLSSSGVMDGYDFRGRTIEGEYAKWKALYGEEEATFLKGLVDRAMPDYEYLRSQRLRPE